MVLGLGLGAGRAPRPTGCPLTGCAALSVESSWLKGARQPGLCCEHTELSLRGGKGRGASRLVPSQLPDSASWVACREAAAAAAASKTRHFCSLGGDPGQSSSSQAQCQRSWWGSPLLGRPSLAKREGGFLLTVLGEGPWLQAAGQATARERGTSPLALLSSSSSPPFLGAPKGCPCGSHPRQASRFARCQLRAPLPTAGSPGLLSGPPGGKLAGHPELSRCLPPALGSSPPLPS